ncbi:MAG: HAD family hydrolase [Proteobacteria bacterium]|nr:HAD family hydrolase [Pseudomonadota bacterium]
MPELMPSKKTLPVGAELDDGGLWSQILNRPQGNGRRRALFLDRDGVIVEDTNYLHRPGDVRVIDGAAEVIAKANHLGIAVIVITNQAGIARGIYGWDAFIEVQEKIIDELDGGGAFINAVFACPYHGDGKPPYDQDDHPWRKPNPGMLLAAAERMALDLGDSWVIGDRAGDLEAARTAGVPGGLHVLTGHGEDRGERDAALALSRDGFQTLTAASIAEALEILPMFTENEK